MPTDILNQDIPLWWMLTYIVYNALVQALPKPKETAREWYVFVYQAAHAIAMNVRVVGNPLNTPAKN